jgi:serine/threonine protein kinase
MHENGVAHRDIKPENIFVDAGYMLKMADFGLTISITGRNGTGRCTTFAGTRRYMAPEIIERKDYSGEAVDLFALGIICFILVTGKPPFTRADTSRPHYEMIARQQWDRFWHSHRAISKLCSPEFKDFI